VHRTGRKGALRAMPSEDSPKTQPAPTPFGSWRTAMGFNGKQVAEAGARVGLSPQAAGHRNRGATEMGDLELMGLTAAFFGLPPWRPDLGNNLDERALTLIRLAREEVQRCLHDGV
jgi:hypothetical protein